MAKTLDKMVGEAVRYATALGQVEAVLTFIASIADEPDLVRQTVTAALADINRILAGKDRA